MQSLYSPMNIMPCLIKINVTICEMKFTLTNHFCKTIRHLIGKSHQTNADPEKIL